MKIIFFVLTLFVFQPFSAQAESVFDQTQSFQICRSVKLGREDSSITYQEKNLLPPTRTLQTKCISKAFRNSAGKCTPCPKHATCNGLTFSCNDSRYFEAEDKCKDICDGTVCKKIDPDCEGDGCKRFEKHPHLNKCYCY